nr:uncharacterized protein LOC109166971 [Ipomoea trifida]
MRCSSKRLADQARQEMLRARHAMNRGHEVGETSSDPKVLFSGEEKEPSPPTKKPIQKDERIPDLDYLSYLEEYELNLGDDNGANLLSLSLFLLPATKQWKHDPRPNNNDDRRQRWFVTMAGVGARHAAVGLVGGHSLLLRQQKGAGRRLGSPLRRALRNKAGLLCFSANQNRTA